MSANLPAKDSKVAEDNHDANIAGAVKRLVQEAHQAVSLPFGRKVRDVTADFIEATAKLQCGQLVKDEYFTLFEAVGALEIMDSKMDSGYVPSGDSFMSDFDVCVDRQASEIIWIMDQLLHLEIIWHEGYPLSQTVFTSLYVDRLLSPDNAYPYTFNLSGTLQSGLSINGYLVHKVLRAFCIGQLKCCQLVLHTITSQNFYEEEDFVTHLFGRELLPRLNMVEAAHLLTEAIVWLEDVRLPDHIQQALLSRLNFRKEFLNSAGGDETGWNGLTTFVKQIQQSHTLGSYLPEAFSDKVQRQLATSTPPRPMMVLTWEEACQKWTKMFTDLSQAIALTSLPICQSPAALQKSTWAFSYLEPQPNTYTRAYFQDILLGSDRITQDITHFDLLLTDIRDLVLAGDSLADPQSFQVEMPSDPRHICARHIEAFMDKAFDEYMNLYRMVCQNRCRIRRTFTQAVPIWDNLEGEAIRVDQIISRTIPAGRRANGSETASVFRPLSTWTKYHKLQLMAQTIQLGFETDIYLPDELSEMYHFFYTVQVALCEQLDQIDTVVLDRMKILADIRNTRYIAETLASQDWIRSLKLRGNIARSMSCALARLYSVLEDMGIIRPPKRDYATKQHLYEARMKPFLNVTHDHISTFKIERKPWGSLQDASQAIDADVRNAKALLQQLKKVTPEQGKYVGTEQQWKKEIKQWETTCVAIAVQTLQLVRTSDKANKSSLEAGNASDLIAVSLPPPGKRYHEWWVVPQIKSKT